MVGDQITNDVLFGRLNKMATVWIKAEKVRFTSKDLKIW